MSFDLDGVILRNPFRDGIFPEVCSALAPAFGDDPMAAFQAVIEEHRRRLRLRDDPSRPYDPVAPYDWDDIFRQVASASGMPAPAEEVAAMVARYAGRGGFVSYSHPTVPAAVRWLREHGHRVVAVTNGLWRYQQPVLTVLGLEELFEAVSAPDRTGTAKPAREAFRAACGDAVAPDAVHVGDDLLYDVAAARRAGLLGVWVMPTELARDEKVRRAPPWERPALLAAREAFQEELRRVLSRRARADGELLPFARPDAAVLHVGEVPQLLQHWLASPARPGPAAEGPEPELDLRPLGDALVAWFGAVQRDLPWRRNPDPYRVLVAEFMLQQTQVATVVPYFQHFIQRFPTVQALAEADEEEVLQAWQGLGYYRRARYLHQAARIIVREHGGRVPEDPAALRRLPGVGPYMAGAVASIAFGRPEPAIDGNAARVLSRLFLLWDDPRGSAGSSLARRWARLMIPDGRARDFTQALMELGARICRPRPRCGECPVQRWCAAWARRLQEQLPVRPARRPPRPVEVAAVRITDALGRILLVRREEGEILGGTWALPAVEKGPEEPWEQAARRAALEQAAVRVATLTPAGELEHTFSHRRWLLRVYDATWPAAAEEAPPYRAAASTDGRASRLRWAEAAEARRLVVSRVFRQALELPRAAVAWPA